MGHSALTRIIFVQGPRPGKGRAWCENPYVDSPDEDSKIWFMSDPSHWVKKVVMHWEKSVAGSVRRDLRIPDA